LLYVEPLYLSSEARKLPELKRLIGSTGERVVMAQSVDSLLAALFTEEREQPPPIGAPAVASAAGAMRPPQLPSAAPSGEALAHYRRAFEALNKGDWRTFGVEMDAMQKSLQANK
jgi:uncharacterized membrane protein (UPF0182 family)